MHPFHEPLLRIVLLLTGMLCLLLCNTVRAELRPLYAGDIDTLHQERQQQTYIMSFWSIDCPPCYRELAQWATAQQQGLPLPLLLISTDYETAASEITQVLKEYGLAGKLSWVFAASPQRLRYEVDHTWRGELPRTYLYRNGQQVEAITGIVDEDKIQRWSIGE